MKLVVRKEKYCELKGEKSFLLCGFVFKIEFFLVFFVLFLFVFVIWKGVIRGEFGFIFVIVVILLFIIVVYL